MIWIKMINMKYVMKILMSICLGLTLISCSAKKEEALPLPELEEGMRGQLGIDKNINEATIDKYLGRSDTAYFDMRMFVDEADYEAIGGDSYLSGYIKGFEVVSYPYLCNVTGLPEEVGESYAGETLFTKDENGEYSPNYKESEHILHSIFPEGKYIFLMCGGGGYAGMTKELLVSQGYDANKIYDIGGYWYYNGENKVDTFYEEEGERYYDFSNVPYHPIVFSSLTPLHEQDDQKGEEGDQPAEAVFIEIEDAAQLKALEDEGRSFLLYVYLPGCSSCMSFKPIVKEFKQNNDLEIYAVDLSKIFKESNSVSDRVSYTPSFFIYENGEVKAFLDPQSDDDIKYYETLEGFSSWVNSYIDVNVLSSETVNEVSDCESACSLTD